MISSALKFLNTCYTPNNIYSATIGIIRIELLFVTEISKFVRWANRKRRYRGLICHFYFEKSRKQFYSTTDYAYFNLFSDSRSWIIKGTPKHGIKSQRGKSSPIPCLNCFEINEKFYEALRTLHDQGNEKYELGIIFNKRKLKTHFKVIDVSTSPPFPRPPPKECHCYDWPRKRRGALYPFNYCDVVRVEIPQSKVHKLPITSIPEHIIMGMLVKQEDYSAIEDLWEWGEIRIFSLL
jgi:hypothetical protein